MSKTPTDTFLFPSMPSTSFDHSAFPKMEEEDIQLNPVNVSATPVPYIWKSSFQFTPPDSPAGDDLQATRSTISSHDATLASNTSFEFMSSPQRPSMAATPAAFASSDRFKFPSPQGKAVSGAAEARSLRSPAESTSSGGSSSLAFIPPSLIGTRPAQKRFGGAVGATRCSLRPQNKVPIYKQKAKFLLPSSQSATTNIKSEPEKHKRKHTS